MDQACQFNHVCQFCGRSGNVKHGKRITDGEYIKNSFIKIFEHLLTDFKNKSEIVQKIRDMPLSAKTVEDRTSRMAEDIT